MNTKNKRQRRDDLTAELSAVGVLRAVRDAAVRVGRHGHVLGVDRVVALREFESALMKADALIKRVDEVSA